MSYLIQLGSRIKATETTKKTTNAMRLIAMSTHMRLRQRKAALEAYKYNIQKTLSEITGHLPQEQPTILGKKLLVVVGSEKGLCGTYNANLETYFSHQLSKYSNYDVMVIGKQMQERLLYEKTPIALSYEKFSLSTLPALTHDLANYVIASHYEAVIIFSTRPKTFFMQSHETEVLIKSNFQYSKEALAEVAFASNNSHSLEQSYETTFNFLGLLALKARIEEILIDSLMAEASSRFLSMDAATRNADDLIIHMKLDHNKLRQTAITRELTDLAGVYMLDV
jgi:F-type H+-transporting ATPase subunit gamma